MPEAQSEGLTQVRAPPLPFPALGKQALLEASQKLPAGQSASTAHSVAQAPAEQMLLRHWVGAAQGWERGLPQRPSAAQTPPSHWTPLVQSVPGGCRGAQVPPLQ
jgi:hypothetical protein